MVPQRLPPTINPFSFALTSNSPVFNTLEFPRLIPRKQFSSNRQPTILIFPNSICVHARSDPQQPLLLIFRPPSKIPNRNTPRRCASPNTGFKRTPPQTYMILEYLCPGQNLITQYILPVKSRPKLSSNLLMEKDYWSILSPL